MSKHEVFKPELELIEDALIREWVIRTLEIVPEEFYKVPASRTGKYHPTCSLGEGGLVVHVKRVVYVCYRLSGGWNIKGRDRDIALAACILHDIAKAGFNSCYQDYENHPINAEKYFAKSVWPEVGDNTYELIRDAVKYHMGCWTPKSIAKPLGKYSAIQLLVYTSDYIAATKLFETPVDKKDCPKEIYKQCL